MKNVYEEALKLYIIYNIQIHKKKVLIVNF